MDVKMLKKSILILLLGLFVITGIYKTRANDTIDTAPPLQSTVYYFHGDTRCSSCYKIETYTKEVFDENFKEDLVLKVINTDKPTNSHFLKDYQLYSKSVVLVKMKNGQQVGYKNLEKIWYVLNDKKKFKTYVKEEIEQFLLK